MAGVPRAATPEEWATDGSEGLHPDDRDLCLETYLRPSARASRSAWVRLRRARGTLLGGNTGVPRNKANGAFAGFMGSAVDISDRRRGVFTPDAGIRAHGLRADRARATGAGADRRGQVHQGDRGRLGISYKTADSHRSRILEKLGVHKTASMVRYAIRAGLIEA